MKIAYLGIKGLPSKSGADRVVEAIVRRLANQHQITVYCSSRYTPPEAHVDGVRLIRLPALSGKHTHMISVNFMAAWHAVLYGDYDLIHLHNVEASFVLPLLRSKYKVIATSHGAAYWRAKWGPLAKNFIRMMDIPFIKLSTKVTCVSAKNAQEFGSRFGRLPLHIPNGVGAEYIPDHKQAKTLLDNHGLNLGKYFIFVAGRIEPTKGAHLAIDAVNHLSQSPPLLIVGDKSHVPDYGRLLEEMAGPQIRFQRFIEDSSLLFGLMKNALCLIFPSTVEAMSMTLLEASCLGIPIVCSDIIENRQVLQDDAIYFESDNSQSLLNQLQWILEHLDDISVISQRAKARISKEYSWDTISARYVQLYQSLLTQN